MSERGGGERRLEAAASATYMIFWQMQLTSFWSSGNPADSQSVDFGRETRDASPSKSNSSEV